MQQEETTWKIFSSPDREGKGKEAMRMKKKTALLCSQYNSLLDFLLKLWNIWSGWEMDFRFTLSWLCSIKAESKNEVISHVFKKLGPWAKRSNDLWRSLAVSSSAHHYFMCSTNWFSHSAQLLAVLASKATSCILQPEPASPTCCHRKQRQGHAAPHALTHPLFIPYRCLFCILHLTTSKLCQWVSLQEICCVCVCVLYIYDHLSIVDSWR